MATPKKVYPVKEPNAKPWGISTTSAGFSAGGSGSEAGVWNGNLAPGSQDWTKGYDALATDGRYARDGKGNVIASNRDTTSTLWKGLIKHANAQFCVKFNNNYFYYPLFVNNLQIDFSISGSTAQSRGAMDFYPHNINIPSFSISGQCYSTIDYGALTEYVHMAQHESLHARHSGGNDLIQFYLVGNVYPNAVGGNPTGQLNSNHVKFTPAKNSSQSGKTLYNQKIVGQHSTMICQGYINTFQRTHQAGTHRPTWNVQFTVSQMLAWDVYKESAANQKTTKTWVNILKGTNSQNWQTKQDQTNNTKTLQAVQAGTSSLNLGT